jgi:hypothetical protein
VAQLLEDDHRDHPRGVQFFLEFHGPRPRIYDRYITFVSVHG